jgi:hypothetical protein
MKTSLCGIALLAVTATAGLAADRRVEPPAPAVIQFSVSGLATPLPGRHQNHCGYYNGRFICAGHCGVNYQVYYCPGSGGGCCHVGLGYCDAAGQLRCSSSPSWF